MQLLDHVSITVPGLDAARPFYDAVMQALGAAGFGEVRRYASLGVFSAYTGRKPESTADKAR